MRWVIAAAAVTLTLACSKADPPTPEPSPVTAIKNFRADPLDLPRLQALVGDASFAGTIGLDISQSPVGDAGWGALGQSPHLGTLTALWLDKTGGTDAGAAALAKAKAPVTELYVGYNALGPVGLAALLDAPAFRLEILRLTFNPITDAGATQIAGHPRLSDLTRLELVATRLTDAGARALLGATLPKLETLDLSHNKISATALEPLLDPGHLPGLRTLILEGCPVDAALKQRVLSARPGLEISGG